eukprot:CAMPEP_0184478342 /NCGR_PEP_ID=MMETSP0113_2-20130426/398_1 /TAXON_ID=91329 /ORGANISM="Norrisiella sphaerica, Strain BC52" /LENGTH=493 /DNA_ID=CAMNT_0026856101 /DNA_START=336 /DNA_END=1814 /DNA_ORIENTATION=-
MSHATVNLTDDTKFQSGVAMNAKVMPTSKAIRKAGGFTVSADCVSISATIQQDRQRSPEKNADALCRRKEQIQNRNSLRIPRSQSTPQVGSRTRSQGKFHRAYSRSKGLKAKFSPCNTKLENRSAIRDMNHEKWGHWCEPDSTSEEGKPITTLQQVVLKVSSTTGKPTPETTSNGAKARRLESGSDKSEKPYVRNSSLLHSPPGFIKCKGIREPPSNTVEQKSRNRLTEADATQPRNPAIEGARRKRFNQSHDQPSCPEEWILRNRERLDPENGVLCLALSLSLLGSREHQSFKNGVTEHGSKIGMQPQQSGASPVTTFKLATLTSYHLLKDYQIPRNQAAEGDADRDGDPSDVRESSSTDRKSGVPLSEYREFFYTSAERIRQWAKVADIKRTDLAGTTDSTSVHAGSKGERNTEIKSLVQLRLKVGIGENGPTFLNIQQPLIKFENSNQVRMQIRRGFGFVQIEALLASGPSRMILEGLKRCPESKLEMHW